MTLMLKRNLLIATKNAGKVTEIENLLSDFPFVLHNFNEFPHSVEPEETGSTFAENAVLKAKSYALQTGVWALADDSGLEVDALNGAPGILSARYAGANATDEQKYRKLLKEILEISADNRSARFVCAIAVADENGIIHFLAEGTCRGKIAFEPRGHNGFGYDPVFIPDGFSKTFGELADEIKQEISHRSQALKQIIQYLRTFNAA
jgi:XTP/dITP diphosphohydrolase